MSVPADLVALLAVGLDLLLVSSDTQHPAPPPDLLLKGTSTILPRKASEVGDLLLFAVSPGHPGCMDLHAAEVKALLEVFDRGIETLPVACGDHQAEQDKMRGRNVELLDTGLIHVENVQRHAPA